MQFMDPTLVALIGALIAAGVTLLLFALMATATDSKRVRGRIARVQVRSRGPTNADGQAVSVRLDTGGGRLAGLERLVQPLIPRPAALRERLSKTGRRITIGQYALACLGVAVAASLIRAAFFGLPPLVAVLFGIVAGLGLPHFWISRLIQRRVKAFAGQFAEAIELIIRGLKSGLPVSESIRTVGDEFDGPVGEEFRAVADRLKVGQPLDEALWEAAKRIDLPDFKFFVISLAVQKETGGNLTETLENLADILRKRRQMVLKVRAMSSEARASALILGSLPFVMFGLMYLVGGDYVMLLFTTPLGNTMLGIGIGFLITGVAVMAKMVRFEI